LSQSYIGQIQPYGFNFAPRNWAQCNGQVMAIQQNPALFSLLGTMYGGNGTTTFALPNLQSRVPMHAGTSPFGTYPQGSAGGVENVTIDITTMPSHRHTFFGSTDGGTDNQPEDNSVLADVANNKVAPAPYYAPDTTPQPINPLSIAAVGGNQPHSNLQPYLAVNWCICTFGVFPSRN